MNVTVNQKPESQKYPGLFQGSNGDVYLLTSLSKGIIIASEVKESIGTFSDDWRHDGIKPFSGEIILKGE